MGSKTVEFLYISVFLLAAIAAVIMAVKPKPSRDSSSATAQGLKSATSNNTARFYVPILLPLPVAAELPSLEKL